MENNSEVTIGDVVDDENAKASFFMTKKLWLRGICSNYRYKETY